jgi:hypothetical protein
MNKYTRILMEEAGANGSAGAAAGGGSGTVLNPAGQQQQQQQQIPSWLQAIPENLRTDPSLANVRAKDDKEAIGVLAQMHINAQKLLGKPRIEKPSDSWTPEQWKSFHKDIGVPETPDKYTLPDIKLAEGLALDDAKMTKWKGKFHELGLTPKQVHGVLGEYMTEMNTEFTGQKTNTEADKAKNIGLLKQEFGDKYDAKIDIARGALRKFGDTSLVETLDSTGLANNPGLVKFLIQVGESTMDDSAFGNGGGGGSGGPGSALQEIGKLKGDAEFMKVLSNRTLPGHKEAVERWASLHKSAYPSPRG